MEIDLYFVATVKALERSNLKKALGMLITDL